MVDNDRSGVVMVMVMVLMDTVRRLKVSKLMMNVGGSVVVLPVLSTRYGLLAYR